MRTPVSSRGNLVIRHVEEGLLDLVLHVLIHIGQDGDGVVGDIALGEVEHAEVGEQVVIGEAVREDVARALEHEAGILLAVEHGGDLGRDVVHRGECALGHRIDAELLGEVIGEGLGLCLKAAVVVGRHELDLERGNLARSAAAAVAVTAASRERGNGTERKGAGENAATAHGGVEHFELGHDSCLP